LSWLRFFWWRFNVWGELAATLLGLPASIYVWFVLDYQNRPLWEGVGILFLASFVILLGVTLLTPPESDETLRRFYAKCRPPGLWGRFKKDLAPDRRLERSLRRELFDCLIGTVACLGLVVATNAVFVLDWVKVIVSIVVVVFFGAWLIKRVLIEAGSKGSFPCMAFPREGRAQCDTQGVVIPIVGNRRGGNCRTGKAIRPFSWCCAWCRDDERYCRPGSGAEGRKNRRWR
jgi:hypothetical protein